ncbi:hypothetical protein QPC78_004511, partial [Escherichia coli]|nr:hypothetical protein [Escherichia coli]ELS8065562.1 hypothetical protein [Escherichia coli]
VKVGDAVKGLDAKIEKGQTVVDIPVKQAIPLLGIRTQTKDPFLGQKGISPQISYGDALDLGSYKADKSGLAKLTLKVKASNGVDEIGVLTTKMFTGAENIEGGLPLTIRSVLRQHLYAATAGKAFFGGLPKSEGAVSVNTYDVANSAGAEYVANFMNVSTASTVVAQTDYSAANKKYSAIYYAGINPDTHISISLKNAATGAAPIQWKASLPITVSYM